MTASELKINDTLYFPINDYTILTQQIVEIFIGKEICLFRLNSHNWFCQCRLTDEDCRQNDNSDKLFFTEKDAIQYVKDRREESLSGLLSDIENCKIEIKNLRTDLKGQIKEFESLPKVLSVEETNTQFKLSYESRKHYYE